MLSLLTKGMIMLNVYIFPKVIHQGKPNDKIRGISRIRNPVTFSCQVSFLDFLWVLPLQCLHLPEQRQWQSYASFYSVII